MTEAMIAILEVILNAFGATAVRKRVDEWELARAASDAAFIAKFGSKP
jgi:hypothetical protein